jgi:predicted TIM-barrel fold metal-dependent hydrolase
MLNPSAVESVCRVSAALARSDALVIDGDTHITDVARLPEPWRQKYAEDPHYYHGRPNSAEDLIGEMDLCGVDMALCWQDPASTFYGDDCDGNAEALLAANRYVFEAARRYPDRILPAGWTDPKACGVANAIRIAEICVCEFGFFVVKMNPAQNGYPIDSPAVAAVVERIVELGAVPAFHFGADSPYTPASGLERLLDNHPGHPFLGVHMGGGGASYEGGESLAHEARELGLRRPQLRYILSTKRDTHMERDILTYQKAGLPFSENLFCGSDAPYGRVAWNFGGFRAMLRTLEVRYPDHFGSAATANLLGRNLARFALEGLRNLLHTHGIPETACR